MIASEDGTFTIISTNGSDPHQGPAKHPRLPHAMACDQQGNTLIVDDNALHLQSDTQCRTMYPVGSDFDDRHRMSDITEIIFSDDGRQCYVAGGAFLSILDWKTKTVESTFPIFGYCTDLKLSTDQKRLLCSDFGKVSYLDLATMEKEPIPFTGSVFQIAQSPDGKTMANSTNRDEHSYGPILVYNRQTLSFENPPQEDAASNSYYRWSPRGRWIARIASPTNKLAHGEKATLTLTSDDDKVLWQAPIHARSTPHLAPFEFSPCGNWIAVCEPAAVRVFRVHDGQQLLSFPTDCWSYAFSSDERRFAISNRSGQVYHWLTEAFQDNPVEVIPHDGKVAFEVAFSPNGEELLTGGTDGTIRIHDLRLKYEFGTWQETSTQGHRRFADNFNYLPHKDRFCVVQQFESGENLVATIHDREIELQESSEIQDKRFAAVHPDGNLLAIAHKTGSTLWDLRDGEPIGRASRDYCLRTAFDPDGKHLASFGSGSIKLHDVATRELAARFEVDRGGFAMDFSPNGDRIVAASWDGTIRIWNTKTMRTEAIIEGHTNFPLDVQFTPDERRLLVVSMTQVTLWDIESKRMALLFSRLPQRDWAFGRIADDNSSMTLIESETGQEFKITMPTEADIQQDLTILDQMGDVAKR